MTNRAELKTLAGEIANCRICIEAPLGSPLPHHPRPVVQLSSNALICIAGQAPGAKVHASGTPFTDASGDRLRDWMAIDKADFYNPDKLAIVPMGFCFPGNDAKGGDLPPRRECQKFWHARIFEAMPQLQLVLVIGQYAQAWHLGADRSKNLTETVKNWQALYARPNAPKILPLPHPSWRNNGWLRKNPWFEANLLPLLKQQVRLLL